MKKINLSLSLQKPCITHHPTPPPPTAKNKNKKKLTINNLWITTASSHQTPGNKRALTDAAESGVSNKQKICMNKKKDSNEPAEQKKYNVERGSEWRLWLTPELYIMWLLAVLQPA